MSTISNRTTTLNFVSDITSVEIVPAATNPNSPALFTELVNFASGGNTINIPAGAKGLTMAPPVGNTTGIFLKGVSGDTGFRIHNTDPSTMTFDTSTTSIVFRALGAITGVRFYWS